MEQAVQDLVANPRPILWLDTCDFLDVVRRFADLSLEEANPFNTTSFSTLVQTLLTDPERFQVVVTYLVRHEFEQNIVEESRKVDRYLEEMDRRFDLIAEACGLGQISTPNLTTRLTALDLTRNLSALAESVLRQALIIDKDERCVQRALSRVMDRQRPSHTGAIKDSIHWEHYLAMSGLLGEAGYSMDRLFVSANKTDFWASKDDPRIHPDLKSESIASGLRFFGRLDEALRTFGLLD